MTLTWWSVARRPRWIAALLLALAIAAGFAALGQWQLGRAVDTAIVQNDDSEQVVALSSFATPQSPVTGDQVGRKATVTGALVPGDFTVLADRRNGDVYGSWLVGRLRLDDGSSLAVAVGWAADPATAAAAESGLGTASTTWTGRYLPSESPEQSDFEHGVQSAMAVPQLINQWTQYDGDVYGGYLVSASAPAGLTPIDSPPPAREATLNWLNIFYAVEWALFAGFAIYLWYRLVRDALEREREEAETPEA